MAEPIPQPPPSPQPASRRQPESSQQPRPVHAITLHVRYVECDMQGHVFNGHYLTWFDMAHTAMLEAVLERRYTALTDEDGVDVVVAESGVRHLAPAHFDDELQVAVALEPPTTSSLTSRFTVTRRPDAAVLATGFLRHVCVDPRTLAKRPWPDEIRGRLQAGASHGGLRAAEIETSSQRGSAASTYQ